MNNIINFVFAYAFLRMGRRVLVTPLRGINHSFWMWKALLKMSEWRYCCWEVFMGWLELKCTNNAIGQITSKRVRCLARNTFIKWDNGEGYSVLHQVPSINLIFPSLLLRWFLINCALKNFIYIWKVIPTAEPVGVLSLLPTTNEFICLSPRVLDKFLPRAIYGVLTGENCVL